MRAHLVKHGRRMALASLPLILAVLHLTGWVPLQPLVALDGWVYDLRMRATLRVQPDDRIVIVDVDEKSLAELGRWPWGRDRIAQLTRKLLDQGAAVIGFDVLFAEPDPAWAQLQSAMHELPAPAASLGQALAPWMAHMNHDAELASVLQGRPVVLGYYLTSDRAAHQAGQLPAPLWSLQEPQRCQTRMTDWSGFGANLPMLEQAAAGSGYFNSITEPDGVVRALPLVAQLQGRVYESLALAMYRQLTGLQRVEPAYAPGRGPAEVGQGVCVLDQVVLSGEQGQVRVPVDDRGAIPIAFRGLGGALAGTFTYLSATDVLAGRVPHTAVRDKLVLVGTTAPGIADFRATPIQAVYPGIEMHANVLAGLLDGRFLNRPPYAGGLEWLLTLALGLVLLWNLPRLRAHWAMALGVLVVLGMVGLNAWAFQVHQLLFGLAGPLLGVGGLLWVDGIYGYVTASRSRRELVGLFGAYVPPEVVREMIKDPQHYTMRARNEELTVMFCDLRGFTQMSEAMPPDELQRLLNHVFSVLTEIIGRHRGTVDKYMGDCVMAFWGAPVPAPLHAELAVRAAMEMAQALQRTPLAPAVDGVLGPTVHISVGIGLNTGMMFVGDMGSAIRRSYTVIGDAVNLASRLEGLSKVYGVEVVVSSVTRDMVPQVVWQELDRVRVKGRAQVISIYTPRALSDQAPSPLLDELRVWDSCLQAYRAQQWAQARNLLEQLQAQATGGPHALYALYAQRVQGYQRQPPGEAWDGVTQFETK
jgi:adenylate cyclase